MGKLIKALARTELSLSEQSDILENNESSYRRYYIEKADGGKREIAEPCENLKKLQFAALPIVKELKTSKYCAAYEKGCSIKLNATKHIKGKHILHLDIKNFFPSISEKMFKRAYKPSGKFFYIGKKMYERKMQSAMTAEEIDTLWSIVSLDGGLPIGATTSPFIANRIMTEIDEKIAAICSGKKYTRYADDLIFSSKKKIESTFISEVRNVLSNGGFTINEDKTYFMSSRKEVTGIIITGDKKLSTGTTYKKALKQDIYNYLVKGEGDASVIRGRFAHLKHIEPQYAQVIKEKYLPYDKDGFLNSL